MIESIIGHNILSSLERAEGTHSPPSFPPSWCLETLIHTLSSPTPRSLELSGNATGDDVRGGRTGQSPGSGANQLALPKRQFRVPPLPQPLACPCHTHVTRVLLTPWQGHIPREGPRGEEEEAGGGGVGRGAAAPRNPRFFPAKPTLKRSIERSQKQWEVTW